MKRLIPILLVLCMLLSGCTGFLDGSFHSVTPHEEKETPKEEQVLSAINYGTLYATLCAMVEKGEESGIISVEKYDQSQVVADMTKAIGQVRAKDPITAYAVKEIRFEYGSNAGQSALAVNIDYLANRTEIHKIQRLTDMNRVKHAMGVALDQCESGVVLYVENYEETDLVQWVKNYAAEHPEKVMEAPEVISNIYPNEGSRRVIELKFAYQNSRDDLKTMQSKVLPLFEVATIYAGMDSGETERYFKLYSFLMGSSPEFLLETSITPAYSLLEHGVGDSRAFALVYAAMCREAGLGCITVTGTRAGEPWYWNIIQMDGRYYHVDLLQCYQVDWFEGKLDGDMSGYVWDYSAYPECKAPEETAEPEETTEPTEEENILDEVN